MASITKIHYYRNSFAPHPRIYHKFGSNTLDVIVTGRETEEETSQLACGIMAFIGREGGKQKMRLPTDNPNLTAILTRTEPTHLTKHRDGTYTLYLNASLSWEEIRAMIHETEEKIALKTDSTS